MSTDYTKSLRDLSTSINSHFKAEVTLAGNDINLSDQAKDRIPTTSFMLNLLLGGGIPRGRVIEIYGEPSHGKSTILQHMMCGVQKVGISVLIDAENSWSRDRAEKMGHNSSRHLHLQPDCLELAFSSINSIITRMRMKGGKFPESMPVVFFYDTLSASPTEGEKEGDQYKDGMSDKARKIRQRLRKLSLFLPQTNCSLVVVNQTIDDIKTGRKTTPGGGGVKFWSSMRFSVWKSGRMDYPVPNTGIIVNVRNVKNKLNPPFRECHLPIRNVTGIDPFYEVLNYLIDNSNYVNVSGGRVVVPDYPEPGEDLKLGYQKQAWKNSTPELLEYLRECAYEVWHSVDGD